MFEVNEYHLEILREAAKHQMGVYRHDLINDVAKHRGDYNNSSDRVDGLVGSKHLSLSNDRIRIEPLGRTYLESLENRVRLNQDEEADREETRRIARRANTLSIIAIVIAAVSAAAAVYALIV